MINTPRVVLPQSLTNHKGNFIAITINELKTLEVYLAPVGTRALAISGKITRGIFNSIRAENLRRA